MAFELTHSKEYVKIENGIQFYWSQKKAERARLIYQKYLDHGSIILDPFLGAGSSLYGIRNSSHKFVGIELNELPFFISKYNAKQMNPKRLESLIKKFEELKNRYLKYYKFQGNDKKDYYFQKVVFENLENLKIKKIDLIRSDGIKTTSESIPESISIYLDRHKSYEELNQKLDDLSLIQNSRIAIKENMRVSNVFSPINFHVLSLIFKETKNDDDLKYLLCSGLHLCRLTDLKSQSQFPYWIPNKNAVDRNVFIPFERKLKSLKKQTLQQNIELVDHFSGLNKVNGNAAFLMNKPAQKMENDIPDSSIDLVLTDPPYFDQVAYSEYLKIWEHFTDLKSNLEDEIVVSQRLQKKADETDYLSNLSKVFTILSKKIKPNGKALVYFKDSRLDRMSTFLELVENAGFSFIGQEYISTAKYTYKQNTSKKTTLSGNNILIFERSNSKKQLPTETSKENAQILLNKFISSYIENNGKIELGKLLSEGLFKYLYFKGALKYFKNIGEIVKILDQNYIYSEQNRSYHANK